MWKIVISFNLNPPLKLFFYLLILTNNNLLLKIYYENIVVAFLNQDFSFFILFFLSFISFSSIRLIFFYSCFSPPHTCPVSYLLSPTLLLFSFSPSFKNILASSHSLSSSSLSLSLSYLISEHSLALSMIEKRKKRGIERKNKIDGSLCRCSSSSPTQSRWVRWLLSFFFFNFFKIFYDLINFKIVFLSLHSDNLIILEFRDV